MEPINPHPETVTAIRPASLGSLGPNDPFAAEASIGSTSSIRRTTVGLLWRFKWLALGVALLIAVSGVIGVTMTQKPLYEAWAVVEVAPFIQRIVYRTDDNGSIPFYEQYLNNQASELRSPTVLNRVLDDADIRATDWYANIPESSSPLEQLRENLEVAVRGRTSYVDVRMQTANPKDAVTIINKTVNEYLRYVDSENKQTGGRVFLELTQEYNKLRQQIETHHIAITKLQEDPDLLVVGSPEQLLAQQRGRLDARQAALEDIARQIEIATWERDQLAALVPASSQPAADSKHPIQREAPPYVTDGEWRGLRTQVENAKYQLETEGANLGDSHFRKVELGKAVEYARGRMIAREHELDLLWATEPAVGGGTALSGGATPAAATSLAAVERRLQRLSKEAELAQAAVNDELKRVETTGEKARLLTKELEDLQYAETQFEQVRARKEQTELESRAPGAIRVQAYAFEASKPANGKRRLMMMAMALAGAIACGIGAAYLRASTVSAVQQASDLGHHLPGPFLGQMPLRRRGRAASPHDDAVVAECVRMIRTALLERLGDRKGHTIQITSAGPGAGKTTLAMLLGRSLTRCGKRVLLIDADLRNPGLGALLGVRREPGLIGVLRARVPDGTAIVGEPGGLNILPAGAIAGSEDPELLANGVLARCIKRWRDNYDVILFDGAPLLPVADARILSRQVDSNVMVVREEHCHRGDVAEALANLQSAGGKLGGVVFFTRHSRSAYPGSYYAGFYGYSSKRGGSDEPAGVA